MIIVKTIEDAYKVPEPYTKYVELLAKSLYSGPWDPETEGYMVFVEETDDLEDLPHLNKEDGGLYCRFDENIGGSWEDVIYYENAQLYEILILCNNEFGITFFVPEECIPSDLLSVLKEYRREAN